MSLKKWANYKIGGGLFGKSSMSGGLHGPAGSAEKKASMSNVKSLEKVAENASLKAARSGSKDDHKAAAESHRTYAKAAEKHYYGFRSSRNTNELLHSSKQAALATASFHDEGRSMSRHQEAAKSQGKGEYLSASNRADMFDKTANKLHREGRHEEAKVRHKMGAEAHREAANSAPDESRAKVHRDSAAEHDKGASGEWDESKHSRDETGKFS